MFGVKIFNPVPVFFLFWGFNFTLSAIVSFDSDSDVTSWSPSIGGGVGKSSAAKSRVKFSGLFRTFIFFFWSSERLSFFSCIHI